LGKYKQRLGLVIHGRFFRCLSIFWGMFSVADRCISFFSKFQIVLTSGDSNLKQMKANIQKEQRTAYWQYIEKMICNIPVDDDKTPTSSKFPKNLFLHLPLSLYFLYFFLYFDIFVFISLVIHGRFFRCLSIFWGMFSVTDRILF
jgi:hypothetical protein